jgi:ABC-type multidrug transport system ATPase subunit
MSVLGHNGAGKTTLINILTGVLNPDSSPVLDIVINNANINNINEVRRHIGVCPQFDILWKEMTAEEHLRLFARLKGVKNSELDARIDEILKFVSLLSEKKARVSSFSGGMKRRLSLAVAAVGNPKIIFLDEPTTGLDPKVRQQVWTLI